MREQVRKRDGVLRTPGMLLHAANSTMKPTYVESVKIEFPHTVHRPNISVPRLHLYQ